MVIDFMCFLVIEEQQPVRKNTIDLPLLTTTEETELETCHLTVLGMTCASCVDSIQRNLSKVEGTVYLIIVK